jgi:hypothetical protein
MCVQSTHECVAQASWQGEPHRREPQRRHPPILRASRDHRSDRSAPSTPLPPPATSTDPSSSRTATAPTRSRGSAAASPDCRTAGRQLGRVDRVPVRPTAGVAAREQGATVLQQHDGRTARPARSVPASDHPRSGWPRRCRRRGPTQRRGQNDLRAHRGPPEPHPGLLRGEDAGRKSGVRRRRDLGHGQRLGSESGSKPSP